MNQRLSKEFALLHSAYILETCVEHFDTAWLLTRKTTLFFVSVASLRRGCALAYFFWLQDQKIIFYYNLIFYNNLNKLYFSLIMTSLPTKCQPVPNLDQARRSSLAGKPGLDFDAVWCGAWPRLDNQPRAYPGFEEKQWMLFKEQHQTLKVFLKST